jgi:hypothetical protein
MQLDKEIAGVALPVSLVFDLQQCHLLWQTARALVHYSTSLWVSGPVAQAGELGVCKSGTCVCRL